MHTKPSQCRGFTLFEILIALAVLTIALGAITKMASSQSLNTAHLMDKTFAHWLAMNKITELQLMAKWPNKGKKQGDDEMGPRTWHWVRTVSETPDDRVRQVEITIYRDKADQSPLTTLTSFLAQPL
jgi:general secretion pathway protein I